MSATIQFKIEELIKRQRSTVDVRVGSTETRFENDLCSTVVYWEFRTNSVNLPMTLSGLDTMLDLEYPGLKFKSEVQLKEVSGYKTVRTIVTVQIATKLHLVDVIDQMELLTTEDKLKLGWGSWREIAMEWLEGTDDADYYSVRYQLSSRYIRVVFERWKYFEKYRGQ